VGTVSPERDARRLTTEPAPEFSECTFELPPSNARLYMKSRDQVLDRLQQWYASMCNGDWEHTYGVFISNIDNPGWSFKVELVDTYLYDVTFDEVKIERADDDWILCKIVDGAFQAYGGTRNLSEMLTVFLDWAEKHS
jgi:Immunity protein 53